MWSRNWILCVPSSLCRTVFQCNSQFATYNRYDGKTFNSRTTEHLSVQIFEFANLQTHIILRNLRPRGSKKRGIPEGWGFGLIACANYFWESCAWITFCALTNTLTGTQYSSFRLTLVLLRVDFLVCCGGTDDTMGDEEEAFLPQRIQRLPSP